MDRRTRPHPLHCHFALAAALLCLGGCQQWDLSRKIPWGEGEDGEQEPPMKLVAIWTDTVLQQPNRPSVRGFGGKLTFFGRRDSIKPIRVAGSLVVYAFDEANRDPANVTPDRKFVFDAEQFKKHHSKDKQGDSYSFWIPWDQAAGEQKEISLIARFTPLRGGTIVSEQTRHLLPGNKPLVRSAPTRSYVDTLSNAAGGPTIQKASYGAPVPAELDAPAAQAPKRLATTTIPLPNHFGGGPPRAEMGPLAANRFGTAPVWNGTAWNGAPAATTLAPQGTATWAPNPNPSPGSVHYEPPKPPALGGPIVRPDFGRAPWQRSLVAPPSPPATPPQSAP